MEKDEILASDTHHHKEDPSEIFPFPRIKNHFENREHFILSL